MSDSGAATRQTAFLFTDIEGSTRLWESFPEAMAVAQAEHDRILRDAIGTHGGEIYRTAGDSLNAVFPNAAGAVAAALASQRALVARDWSAIEELRVRMAVDLAPAERSDAGDYRSPHLSLLDWMMSSAQGSQILVSATAASGTALPEGAGFVELGRFAIPGMRGAETIFQLIHPEVPSDISSLRAQNTGSNYLRQPEHRLIGRRTELVSLHELLETPGVRLVTLIGPGGIGKTRLVEQLALERSEEWGETVWFVDLVGISDPAFVISEIAATLHIAETGQSALIDTVSRFLADTRQLLVLDNFEHLLPAAQVVADLLERVPDLHVVVTSRSPLRLRGEWQFPVEPLSIPVEVVESWEALNTVESVQLFLDRATAVAPAFALTAQSAGAVAGICRKLEGVPLAIELAAPRIRVLTADELDLRLGDRLGLIADRASGDLGRHGALRDSIAWSYDLLPRGQQWFFRQLGVFQSGFALETLDGVFGAGVDTLGMVEALLEQNLIRRGQRGDPDRFHLLESVRQYALEQLRSHDELDAMQRRHAGYFSMLLLDRYADQRSIDAAAVTTFTPALDDLRQAILWSAEHDPGRSLAIAAVAWRLWYLAGQLSDADLWLRRVLDATGDQKVIDRVRTLNGRAIILHTLAEMNEALRSDQASRALAEEIGDDRGIGDACNHMVGVVCIQNQMAVSDEIRELDRAAMAAYVRCGDEHGIAETRLNRAAVAYFEQRIENAFHELLAVLDYCRSAGKDVLASNTIHAAVEGAIALGRTTLARELLIEAFEINIRLGYDIFVSANLSVLTSMMLTAGQPENALRLAEFAGRHAAELAPGGDAGDAFGRVQEERAAMEAALTPEQIERALAGARRLHASEAVAQALGFLRDDRIWEETES